MLVPSEVCLVVWHFFACIALVCCMFYSRLSSKSLADRDWSMQNLALISSIHSDEIVSYFPFSKNGYQKQIINSSK